SPLFRYVTEVPPPEPATIAPWRQGGFLRDREIYPMLAKMVAWQPPGAESRPVPIGSRSIGVSLQPAIPRRVAPQQSPLPLHQSPRILAQSQSGEAIKCALNFRKDAAHAVARRWVAAPALAVSAANPSVISTLRGGCHFYLAPT